MPTKKRREKHPIYDEPQIDWRFKSLLQQTDGLWQQKVEATKQPGGDRDKYGNRMCWITQLPAEGLREEARKVAKESLDAIRERHPVAGCPCCLRHFGILSDVISIAGTGLCQMCKLFEEGKFEGVIQHRPPTFEEAMAAPEHDIRPAEALVFRQALLVELRSHTPKEQ